MILLLNVFRLTPSYPGTWFGLGVSFSSFPHFGSPFVLTTDSKALIKEFSNLFERAWCFFVTSNDAIAAAAVSSLSTPFSNSMTFLNRDDKSWHSSSSSITRFSKLSLILADLRLPSLSSFVSVLEAWFRIMITNYERNGGKNSWSLKRNGIDLMECNLTLYLFIVSRWDRIFLWDTTILWGMNRGGREKRKLKTGTEYKWRMYTLLR